MQLKVVQVTISSLEPLHQYQNVKPEVSLTAELQPGEDYRDILRNLAQGMRGDLEDLIDQFRTDNGLPLRYYTGPTYSAKRWIFYNIDEVILARDTARCSDVPGSLSTFTDQSDHEFRGQHLGTLRAWLNIANRVEADVVEDDLERWVFNYLSARDYLIVVSKQRHVSRYDTVTEYALLSAALWQEARSQAHDVFAGSRDQIDAWLTKKNLTEIQILSTLAELQEWSDSIGRASSAAMLTEETKTEDADDDADDNDA